MYKYIVSHSQTWQTTVSFIRIGGKKGLVTFYHKFCVAESTNFGVC